MLRPFHAGTKFWMEFGEGRENKTRCIEIIFAVHIHSIACPQHIEFFLLKCICFLPPCARVAIYTLMKLIYSNFSISQGVNVIN